MTAGERDEHGGSPHAGSLLGVRSRDLPAVHRRLSLRLQGLALVLALAGAAAAVRCEIVHWSYCTGHTLYGESVSCEILYDRVGLLAVLVAPGLSWLAGSRSRVFTSAMFALALFCYFREYDFHPYWPLPLLAAILSMIFGLVRELRRPAAPLSPESESSDRPSGDFSECPGELPVAGISRGRLHESSVEPFPLEHAREELGGSGPMTETPVFPLRVRWLDGETDEFEDDDDLICNLEDFDSDSPRDSAEAEVVDALGRPVKLFVSIIEGRCDYALQ